MRTHDGGRVKIDFDIACRQSVFFREMRDNFETKLDPADFSDTQSEFSTYNIDGEIELNLTAQSMMTAKMLAKVVEFWTHADTKCAMPPLQKPLRPTQLANGKVSCNLYLVLPPWHANFVLSSFRDKAELSQGLLIANYFNAESLIEVLSLRMAQLMIEAHYNNASHVFAPQESADFQKEIGVENAAIRQALS